MNDAILCWVHPVQAWEQESRDKREKPLQRNTAAGSLGHDYTLRMEIQLALQDIIFSTLIHASET